VVVLGVSAVVWQDLSFLQSNLEVISMINEAIEIYDFV